LTAQVYTDLVERLWDKVEGLLWTDLWNSQIANEDKEYPILFPAVFLHFKEGADKEMSYELLEVTGILTAVIVFENYEDHYKSEYKTLNQNALQFMAFKDKVTKALHGFKSEMIKSLQRKSQRLDSSFTNLYIVELDFEISYYDLANVKQDYQQVNPVFAYTKEIVSSV
jgi:hypothetical protein